MPSKKTRIIYRSAITGEFITEKDAKKHPTTTVKETIKIVSQKKPSSGKKK